MNKLKATLLTKTGLNRVLIRLSHEIMEKHASIENLALIGIRTRGEIIAKRIKLEKDIQKWITKNPDYHQKTIITVPVVVHVVYNAPQENISDQQIQSQIDVLNKDYRRTNIDNIMTPSVWTSIAADCEIEFCLASTDPNGNNTNGITRTQTTTSSFSMQGDPVKDASSGGKDAWPNNDYLNIWVCKLSGGLLGYATTPFGSIGSDDGVVIGYSYFGTMGTVQNPYNKGRTATHEVGHWLNLEHLWGGGWGSCGNDNVSDTPTQEEENYGCPAFPHNANSCNTTNSNGDMFMNYMDYSNDGCMNLFTQGQKTRMIAAISQSRQNLLNHNLCGGGTSDIDELITSKRALIKIVDILGREVKLPLEKNRTLFYIYEDGTVEKKMLIE